ncbi:MAG: hypothetical protein KatS3mg068_0959 [Candidatus Sericytochromatia bacterium]|nr:MAG: hypothetical protein KatS3mg068_0959 [Candidatus Sericytochromatia bacterium]
MIIKKILLSFTLILLLNNNSFANDDDRKLPRPPLESSGTMIINWQLLNLTPEQKERIRTLRIEFQKLSIKLKSEIDLKQLEIEKLLLSPNSDPNEIRKLLREKILIESKLKMEALENFLSIKFLLNSEQLAKLPKAVNLK